MSEDIKSTSESNENSAIENVRWTINKISKNEIKDELEIAYTGKEMKCIRCMNLIRKQ
jgi:hypothetical protein